LRWSKGNKALILKNHIIKEKLLDLFQAVSLGIIQGLTEFLPVSSSGHLVLMQNLFGLKEPELLLDICLHVGTLLAVVVVFFRDINELLVTMIKTPKKINAAGSVGSLYESDETFRLGILIICGSIPTALLGILFSKMADALFGSIALVGIALLVTGATLWMTRYMATRRGRSQLEMRMIDAVIIGIVQGFAIIPGISRSGSTIAAGLFLGVNREVAGRFSFLLSLPAILGALILSIDADVVGTGAPFSMILAGSVVSAVVGYLALIILLKVVKKGKFSYFAPYCWLVGGMALLHTFLN
jgi:undecaprenyl-diphosphatase